jgi:hypothetical protein
MEIGRERGGEFMNRNVLALALLLAASLFWAPLANADPDPSQAQDWTVDGFQYFGKGLMTPMLLQTYVASGHSAQDGGSVATDKLIRTSLRLFYGLTDDVNLFMQVNTAHPDGQSYEMEGFEGGFHVRLYEGHGFHLGFAWENEWQRSPKYVDVAYDMDFHPLIQQDIGKFTILLNPIVEKDFVGAGAWEGSYAAQVLYHWSDEYSAGLEFYGDVGEFKHMPRVRNQAHYVMPVVNWKDLSFGSGVGLTSGSDRLAFKVNLSYPFSATKAIDRLWGDLPTIF